MGNYEEEEDEDEDLKGIELIRSLFSIIFYVCSFLMKCKEILLAICYQFRDRQRERKLLGAIILLEKVKA